MYGSIVVGTDGSATAEDAVRRAAALAQMCGAQLTVVSAFRPVSATASPSMAGAGVGFVVDTEEVVERHRLEAEEALEHAVMALGETIVPAIAVRPGEPADVLLAMAAEVGADLIVVADRGMQGAQRFLPSSVPTWVVGHARCSVLIVQTP
ncbi:MAG: universal stress protein [Mycobacteriales bacterium]